MSRQYIKYDPSFRYSVWEPNSAEMAECSGGVAVCVSARRVMFEGGQLPYLQLDEHRLAFSMILTTSLFNIGLEFINLFPS